MLKYAMELLAVHNESEAEEILLSLVCYRNGNVSDALTTEIEVSEGMVHLKLEEAVINELTHKLLPNEGEIQLSSTKDFMIQVAKTYIKDQSGNVTSVIG